MPFALYNLKKEVHFELACLLRGQIKGLLKEIHSAA